MTGAGAERSITTSAVIVAAVYGYRYLTEGQSGKAAQHLGQRAAGKQLAGAGGVPPLTHFIVGYGFAFMVISALAQADPALGGGLAVILATSTLLANGVQIFSSVETAVGMNTLGSAQTASPTQQQQLAGAALGQAVGSLAG